MIPPELRTADKILRDHRIEYVVVGGQAIGASITTTEDVDVMVTTSSYSSAVEDLRSDDTLEFLGDDEGVATFGMRSLNGIHLDLLDASSFSGAASGEDFFEFLVTSASNEKDGIRYARPEIVWYTRLMVRRWQVYAEKIIRNIVGGLGTGLLQQVDELAGRFGTEAVIRERVAYVRSELQRPDLEYVLSDT